MKTTQMIEIDGAVGEGGGQILRSSLALSVCWRKPFKMVNIRAKRKKPGLLRQHLTAVKAAVQISHAKVTGDSLGSQSLVFEPSVVQAGDYRFAIGTAGSATLVLQTILLPLLFADGPSKVRIEGGTHNPFAPPFDFLAKAFIPVLEKMGASLKLTLVRPGFYPAGGGVIDIEVMPGSALLPVDLTERGEVVEQVGQVLIADLPVEIAAREINALKRKLNWPCSCFSIIQNTSSDGPGNIVSLRITSEHGCEVLTGFGQKGVRAESIANRLVKEVRRYLTSGVPVGEYLADQLLLPFALAGAGQFVTMRPSTHTMTNMVVIEAFTNVGFRVTELDRYRVSIAVVKNAE